MEPNQLLYLILGVVIFDYATDQALNLLNYKRFDRPIPKPLEDVYSEEEYRKSQAYQKEKAKFGLSTSVFSTLLSLLIIGFGGFGFLDQFLRGYINDPVWLGLAFFAVIFICSDLVNLPFSYYATFVIEQNYGFNKTTLKTFFLDKIKGYFLALVIGLPLGYALLKIVLELGGDFWIYALLSAWDLNIFGSI